MLAQFYNEANYIDAAKRAEFAAYKDEIWDEAWAARTRKTVLKMFAENMPVATIAKVEDISEAEVLAIRKEYQQSL